MPYSNVRLFLWMLGGDIEWCFNGLSEKNGASPIEQVYFSKLTFNYFSI